DFALSNPYYKLFISNYDGTDKNKRETSLRTALMLVLQLQQYIHNIDKIPSTGVLVDFAEVIHEFIKPELWEADGIIDSDHVILKTSWKINLRAKPRRKKKTIRKCYQYDKTSEEDWTEFRKFIGEKMYTENKTKLEQQIDKLRKALHKAREVENQKEKKNRIQLHVIRKRDKFTDNTKGMIKSVLKQKVASVILNNLKQKDSIITDVRRIKKEIEEHFSKWTNTSQPATPIWQDWIVEYNPNDQVDSSWFEIMVSSYQGEWPKPLKKRGKSINRALCKMKGSNKIKESTNRHGIIFIEHLLNNDCSQVTSWMGVQNNTKKIAIEKTPKWFTDVQQTLAEMEHPSEKEETNPFT
ncbi:23852_t:CDS:2, partial [Gigaspora margarita]